MTEFPAKTESIDPEEFDLLVVRYIDNLADAAETERLSQCLAKDSSFRAQFATLCTLGASLREILLSESFFRDQTAMVVEGEEERHDDYRPTAQFTVNIPNPSLANIINSSSNGKLGLFSSEVPFACFIATVVMIIGLAICANIYVSHSESQQQVAQFAKERPLATVHESMPELVGRITGMAACRWAKDGRPPYGYDNVPVGRQFKLDSGSMEITYYSGAKVILQGPCAYEVNSATGGYLTLGKLTARVDSGHRTGDSVKPQAAAIHHSSFSTPHSPYPSPLAPRPSPPFTVQTPTAVITDLGTEFGVEQDSVGNCIAYVFQGEVELQAMQNGAKAGIIRLAKNESARVEKNINRQAVISPTSAVATASLPRYEQLARLFQEGKVGSSQERHARYTELMSDPSLVVYYDFQRREEIPNVLYPTICKENKVESVFNGKIENAAWTMGRLPGKESLQFDGCESRVRLDLPQKLEQMTLLAWLTIELSDCDAAGILTSDDWDVPGRCCWQINRQGEMLLRMRSNNGALSFWTSPIFPWYQVHPKRWHMLAVSFDGLNQLVSFYCDGQVVREVKFHSKEKEMVLFGPSQLGNSFEKAQNGQALYGFRGRIGELAIFSRVLQSDEIRKLYLSSSF